LKKLVSILLLAVLLFNLLGYRLVYSFLERSVDDALELRLDHHLYAESELITVRVPMDHLPYYSNSGQYEPIDGKIELEGIHYHFVKQRVYHDSLELLCIPDHESVQLQSAKDDFFKLVNDLEHASQGKKSGAHSGSSKDFSTDCFVLHSLVYSSTFFLPDKSNFSNINLTIPSYFLAEPDQPPRRC
jgi:hypothetical protein